MIVSHLMFPCSVCVQIDVLEDPVIRNVIILQTVLQEVRHRSAPVYKRVKDMIHEKDKHFYTFTNEHHRYKHTTDLLLHFNNRCMIVKHDK